MAWTFSDGSPSLTGVTASKTFATPGNYTVTLTVTDNRGATGRATQGITVAANAAPTAAITANPTTGKEPLTVALDGSGSRDTDGTIASYTWSFSDGSPSISGVTASKTFNTPGNYTVTLTVTDNEGATGTATRGITVTANAAPTASFTATPISGRAPLLVSFDGSASRDPDGTIAGYQWAFGDGGTGSGATVQHTYNAAGTFTATLTVTDNQGATGTVSRTITVTPPVGSLSVTVKDTNGVGIAGAAVVATVGGASRSGTTNASGVALLTDVLAGTGTVDVSRESFVAKTGTAVTIAANATTSLDVTLVRITSATGGVLETRVPVGGVTDGGKTLEFSIRVVVVDDKSVEVKGLPPTAFTLRACTPDAATTAADCVSGGPADVAYTVLGPGAAPSFEELAGGAPQPYAATLMFDQSASIIRNDPTDARLFSAKEFLSSLGGSDVAAVAAFADGETAGALIPVRPVTIYPVGAPAFFSDGTALFSDLDSLAGLEGGGTPLYEAICRVTQGGRGVHGWPRRAVGFDRVLLVPDAECRDRQAQCHRSGHLQHRSVRRGGRPRAGDPRRCRQWRVPVRRGRDPAHPDLWLARQPAERQPDDLSADLPHPGRRRRHVPGWTLRARHDRGQHRPQRQPAVRGAHLLIPRR